MTNPNHPHGHVSVGHVASIVTRQIAEKSSYYEGGKVLTAFLFSVLPDGVDPDDWDARYAGFIEAMNTPGGADADQALAWLDRELPGIMEAIPTVGRLEFVKGVMALVLREPGSPIEPRPFGGRRRTRRKV
jgi:hypothetical protein